MQRFTDLKVWQKSHAFVLEVYRVTRAFPPEERFELTAQLRGAALSVPTNIAEGSKRESRKDYGRFLNLAESSLAEAEYLLIVGRDLNYLDRAAAAALASKAAEIGRMLDGLRKKVKSRKS